MYFRPKHLYSRLLAGLRRGGRRRGAPGEVGREDVVDGVAAGHIAAAGFLDGGVKSAEGDEEIGRRIVLKAIEAPLRTIAENAGAEGSVVVEAVKRDGKGFNAETLTYEDLAKSGVGDPTKVVRQSLQNAASISGLLLTTEAIVAEIPQEEEDQGHGHHHH